MDFDKADFNLINEKLRSIDWDNIFSEVPFEEIPPLFTMVLLQICEEYIPKKRKKLGKPKILHALRRKKKRLLNKLDEAKLTGNLNRINKVQRDVSLIAFDMKEAILNNQMLREGLAISQIKSNPKSFCRYAFFNSQ